MGLEHDEGWYTDPFARHEARWMSDGRPTKLIRDGAVEGYDDPPDEAPSRQPVKLENPNAGSPDDIQRADDETSAPFDDEKIVDAVFDHLGQNIPPGF